MIIIIVYQCECVCEYNMYIIHHNRIGSVICFTRDGFYLVDKKNTKCVAGCMFPIIFYIILLCCIYIRIKNVFGIVSDF